MIKLFPPANQNTQYLQTNRSDVFGSLWSSFNLDFQNNMGSMRLANKLVTNTTSSDDADLGRPVAFEFYFGLWWAICGTRIFKNSTTELTSSFTEDSSKYQVGDSTTQFDVTLTGGTTYRYTYDGTGTDPGITALTFPIGSSVTITGTNLAAGNRGTFTVTGSGANYFEVTNAGGVVESNKTISTGNIAVSGGTLGQGYGPMLSDLKRFNARLWSTTDTVLWSKDSDTANWVSRDTINSGSLHVMTYFKKFDRLYYKNTASTIRSISTGDVVASSGDYFIDLGSSVGLITSIVGSSQIVWIGTDRTNSSSNISSSGLQGSIFQWDGFTNQIANEFLLPSGGCLSMVLLNDVPYVMDTEGRLLKFTGYSFEEIARLPVDRILLTSATASLPANGRFVHFNGMQATKNNTILVLINNLNEDNGGTVNENCPSGIWECNIENGSFTHKYSPTLKARSSSAITDFGQNRILGAGALKINTLMSSSANGMSTLIAGFSYYTDATTTKSGIFIDSPASPTTDNEGQKRGYFVTTWFSSDRLTDKWNRIFTTFRRFLNSADKITFKYRLNEEDPVLASITWVDTTHFTTVTDVTAYDPATAPFKGTYGGEVEILQGTGSGACVHILAIVNNAGTYTVTIDNAVTGVTTGTAKARFQKWIKLLPEITGQVLSYAQMAVGDSNTRIQLKGVLEFTGDDEFQKLLLSSEPELNINI